SARRRLAASAWLSRKAQEAGRRSWVVMTSLCRSLAARLLLRRAVAVALGGGGRGAQALLQRRHQVDHLGVVVGRLHRLHLPALALLLDERADRVLVAVVEFAGVEVARLLVDDLLGDLQHLRVGLGQARGADVLEAAHLLRGAQGGE